MRLIHHKARLSAVHTNKGTGLLVIFHGAIFSSTQTVVILGDHSISMCSYIQFLVVEQFLELAIVLAIYTMINHVCLSGNTSWSDHQMISKIFSSHRTDS